MAGYMNKVMLLGMAREAAAMARGESDPSPDAPT